MNEEELKEFSLFLKGNLEPPPAISQRIFSYVHAALNPSIPWTVFKVFLFHVLGSAVTLFFCPQYGISFIGSSQGIMPYIIKIHPAFCFVACGFIWMIGGQLLSYFLLTIDEKRVMGGYRWGFGFAAIGMSLLMFGCLGQLNFDLWLGLWILGAVSIVIFWNWRIDFQLRQLRALVNIQT